MATWDRLWNTLRDLNVISIAARMILSILFGALIGRERQGQHHPAGVRTHILVCMGSAMTMMLGQYLTTQYGSDPARIGAQVVSGIGFLGVGTIVSDRGHVRGITTAAGIWASASMGLALGAGFYEGAVIGFACVMFTLLGIRKITAYYYRRNPRKKVMTLYLDRASNLPYITGLLQTWGVQVVSTHLDTDHDETDDIVVTLELQMRSHVDTNSVLVGLLQEKCVHYADYVNEETTPVAE